ncbi:MULTISPECIES: hypothetical protein [unclassified Streptomyces]|nr:hypothetical protein [Streptomyces sp. DK15]MDX2388930.1 hypothetical protein [Streptomyces sp. DK15]
MVNDEDRILADALGAAGAVGGGSGGRFGARLAARYLRKDVHETVLTLELPADRAASHVAATLARVGRLLDAPGPDDSCGSVVRALVGGGFGGMNPVVVTVTLTPADPGTTTASVRGAAKEGLIKQHAGLKTTRLVTDLLTS